MPNAGYSWLGSDSPAIANHVRDAFTQVANTKPLLLASTCLAGIASRTAVDPGQTSGLELAVKGSALRRLQMRLEDWDQTAADEVVRSILMLVTFEVSEDDVVYFGHLPSRSMREMEP